MRIGIVGAGVAGPTAAHWLNRSGHEITLLEKAPALRTGGYIIDFWGLGYRIAQEMGIEQRVRSAGYQVEQTHMVDREGRIRANLDTGTLTRMVETGFTSLPRSALAAAIYETVADRVETVFDAHVTGIENRPDAVEARFADGSVRAFDLLIGADGLHSAVRGLVFGPERQFEKYLGYRVAAFELDGYPHRDPLVYVLHSTPGTQAARFTLRGGRTVVLLVFAESHMPGPDPETLEGRKAVLHGIFDDAGWECRELMAAMDAVPELYFDRVSQIHMGTWSSGRVMLIGDAAACVSLLAGEGTGLGMTQAYVLAGELKRAQGDYGAAFRQHERRLRSFLAKKQKGAAKFASTFAPKSELGIWIRNHAVSLMKVPMFANWFVGASLRDDFDLPHYEF